MGVFEMTKIEAFSLRAIAGKPGEIQAEEIQAFVRKQMNANVGMNAVLVGIRGLVRQRFVKINQLEEEEEPRTDPALLTKEDTYELLPRGTVFARRWGL